MSESPRLPSDLFKKFPGFPFFLLITVLVVVVHFWQPSNPLNWALQAGMFLAGGTIAHAVFLFENFFGKTANTIGESLANNRLTSDLPAASPTPNTQGTPTSLTDSSPLKQGLILFLLPIVGIFLLSSSRLAVGLGFLFGISWVYFSDILAFLRNTPSEFPDEYFPPQQAKSRSVQTALIWYGLYMLLLVLALLLL